MILSKYGSSLQFCTCRDKKWKEYRYVNKGWRILDIIVFDGRIYVLNSDSQIGIFNLRSCDLRFLELKFAPYIGVYFDKQVRLVASNDQLFVVDSPELYRIDLSRMEWVKLYNLGEDQALFRGNDGKMCSKVINPSKWGGQSNCIHSISISSTCVLQPRKTITTELPEQGFGKCYDCNKICSLYFLNQIENVRDE
ncbi:hypothetical protein Pint_30915 [Pistacia integerrima]|uniref:Uncharacterized protein n=1 Tax=Pistacia integerrima TaxID=434235 RepID=A0ACC0XS41_9ROSI|nr:hypothetical protein Pint_30915 [Pistacia integerrima]